MGNAGLPELSAGPEASHLCARRVKPRVRMLLHPAAMHSELGVLARRRTNPAASTEQPSARSLPAHRLRVGLGWEHLCARLLDQAPTRESRKRGRVWPACPEVRLSVDAAAALSPDRISVG